MTNLTETSTFEAGIYQLETTDPVVGGPSGISNAQAKSLANRTRWLKDQVDALNTSTAGLAPLNSPALIGTPTAPTQATGNSSTRLATTAFVAASITAAGAGYLQNPSPALTGAPTAPTAAGGTNNTQIATTAFVQAALSGGITGYAPLNNPLFVSSDGGAEGGQIRLAKPASGSTLGGHVIMDVAGNAVRIFEEGTPFRGVTVDLGVAGSQSALWHEGNLNIGLYAPLASPGFSGAPTAPTPAGATNNTQLATTAFVRTAISTYAVSGLQNPSPALTGTPTAPTAAAGTSTTQIATTAFVRTAISAATGSYLSNPSPGLTGTPTAPTAGAGTNTTQIATTAFATAAISALRGLAPANMDTLQKIAAALGNDAAYSTNVNNSINGLQGQINNRASINTDVRFSAVYLSNGNGCLYGDAGQHNAVIRTGASSDKSTHFQNDGNVVALQGSFYNGSYRTFDTANVIPIANGGTGSNSQAGARNNLGLGTAATRNWTLSTSAPSGGSNGDLWFIL